MILPRIAISATLLAMAAPAVAQDATFTVKDGRALIVGGETELGAGLVPTEEAAAKIVDDFASICLPDPGAANGAVEASRLGLVKRQISLPASGSTLATTIDLWSGPSATVLFWQGDEQNFKGRPIAMPSRAGVTVGPYGPFRAFGTQCNMVLKVVDFVAAKAVAEAMSTKFGAPGKLVIKNTFADGNWRMGGVRLNINVPTTRFGPQPLHISAQVFPEKGKK